MTASPSTLLRPSSATRSCALRSIGSEMSTPNEAVVARIVRQRDAGADADLEDAAADALGRRDRGLPAALEHRAEHQIVDRRPARIGLRDRVLVEFRRVHRRTVYRRAIPDIIHAPSPRQHAALDRMRRGLPIAT